MINQEIAEIFYEIADILEMKDIAWKPQAYRKAARSLETLSEDVRTIYKENRIKALKKIPGVGEALAKKIIEYIETKKIKGFQRLKDSLPKGMDKLMEIEGLGPKKISKLYKKLKIKNVKDLQKAIKFHKIRSLETFGEKTEENLKKSLDMFKKGQERVLLGIAIPISNKITSELKKVKGVEKVITAGSLRRMKETVGDLDILVVSKNPEAVMNKFTSLDEVSRVLAKGKTKSSVVLKNNLQADIRVVESKSFGAALNYFTGSKDHNVRLRQIALKKGLKLSEYGLFLRKTNAYVAGKSEEELYKKFNMPYIEPELRENNGEIEAALKNKLPKLITHSDIISDLQMHSKYSDGFNTIEEMALAAKELNYEYILITDHSKTSAIANGMDEKRLLKQIEEIDKLNNKLQKIKILKGAEVDILKDGSLDFKNEILKKLDIVVVAIHSGFKSSEEEMTKRIIKGLENEYAKILSHPTGRLINKRAPYNVNIDRLIEFCKDNNKILEINSFPTRLDLKDAHIRLAIQNKVKLSIGTDSHNQEQLKYINLGIAQARRGWATKNDIINCLNYNQLKKVLKIS